jgi:hypothetical protein
MQAFYWQRKQNDHLRVIGDTRAGEAALMRCPVLTDDEIDDTLRGMRGDGAR